MRSYRHLSEDERDQIGIWRAAGRSVGAIARAHGRQGLPVWGAIYALVAQLVEQPTVTRKGLAEAGPFFAYLFEARHERPIVFP